MGTNPNHQREQARVRQARHRRRETADRIELKATTEAAKLPLAWRPEFLDVVRRDRARAEKALAQVEKAALVFPEGAARDAYLKRNYPNTKVSVSRLFNQFVRLKTNLAQVELYQDAEYDRAHDDFRPDVEDVEWGDLQEVAYVLGDPADEEVAALQPLALFVGSVLLAGISMGSTPTGFAQALELFKLLGTSEARQVDAEAA